MNNGTVGSASIRIDADTASAVAGLRRVSNELESLIPGGNAVASVFERIQGGALQLVQGMSRNIFQGITQSMSKMVSAGIDTAKTIESAKVAFDNLLTSGENVDELLLRIQEDATQTPFDVDALTLSTQKLALITKNGAQAEQTVLALGKALAAAGRGTAEMNRMATNLQQIGQNAKATERDLREFGNAGVDVVGIVTQFSDEFKAAGIKVTEARDWLKKISDPYTVITNAMIKAGESTEGFARIYEDGAQTIGQALENMSDSIGIFGMRVMQQSGVIQRFKSILRDFQDALFLDHTFTANAAQAVEHLLDAIKEADIIRPILEGIRKVVSAFAAGQFDNVIVFFKNLFNAIKQFSGLKVISNIFKVIFDLFSDNHTAEEVAKVATQIGNLIRYFLELKMAMSISNYAFRLTESFILIYNGISTLIPKILNLGKAFVGLKTSTMGIVGVLGAVVAGIALFSQISDTSITDIFGDILDGIKSFFSALGDAAKQIVNFGWNIIVGLYNGIVEGFNAVIGKIREIAQAIIDAFANVFQIHSPSKIMRNYIGHNIMYGIIAGINDMRGAVMAAIEEVQEELVKLQADFVKELYNFGALDLVDQVRVYKEFASLYAKGTRARLEMDEKVHDAETSIIKEMIDLIEDFNKAFDKAFHGAKDYYNMFEYTQITLTRTTKSVIEGLRRQNDNMEKYYKNLYQMSQMGFDDDFMAYVYDQGMDAAVEVAGLAEATKEQIEEINEMWRTRGKIATDIAVLNTQKLREETLEELDYLQTGLETKALDYYDSGTYLMYRFTRAIYDAMPTVEDALLRVTTSAAKGASKAADDALNIDTSALQTADYEVEKFTADAKKMEVQMFDTSDALSFIKNLLSGIPWWGWAAAGVSVLSGVAKYFGKTKDAVQTAKQAVSSFGSGFSGVLKTVTQETLDFSGASGKITAQFKNSAKTTSEAYSKMADSIEGSYTKTVKTTQQAADKTSKIAYDSSSKVGREILKPFRTFATKVDGFFANVQNIINHALDLVLDTVIHFASKLMELLKTITRGIGEAIKALIEPLSKNSKSLFKGVAVLAAFAVTLMIFAEAAKVMNQVEWESLGKIAVLSAVVVAVTYAMQAIGKVAHYVLLGAAAIAAAGLAIGVATAALGLGLKVFTESIADASHAGAEIDLGGLAKAILAVTTVTAALSLNIVNSFLGAISGLFAMAAAGELLVVTRAFAEASSLADQIVPENLAKIADAIAYVGVRLTASLVTNFIGAISGLFGMMASGELLVIAEALSKASTYADKINVDALSKIADSIVALSGKLASGIFATFFGMFSGAFSTVVADELVLIARSLGTVSQEAEKIVPENIEHVGAGIAALNRVNFGFILGNLQKAFASANLAGVTKSLITIVDDLSVISKKFEENKDIKPATIIDGIQRLQYMLASIQNMFGGDFITALFQNWQSGSLVGVAENVAKSLDVIEDIIKKTERLDKIAGKEQPVIDRLTHAKNILNVIASSFNGNALFGVFQNWQSGSLVGVAENVAKTLDAIRDIIKRVQNIEKTLPSETKMEDYIEKIKEPINKLDDIFDGNWIKSKRDKWQASNTTEIASSVDTILGTIQSICNKMSEFAKENLDKTAVENLVGDVKEIVQKIADISFSQKKNALESVKKKAEEIREFSSSFDTILGTVQSMGHKLREMASEGLSIEDVRNNIGKVEQIVWRMAEISFSQSGDALAEVAQKADSIQQFSSNFDTILGTVQSMCNKLKELDEEGYNVGKGDDKDVKSIITKVGQIVNAVASINIDTEADLGQMAEKAENLKNLSTNVNEVVKTLTDLIENLKKFNAAYEGTTVAEQIQHINKDILEPIIGTDDDTGLMIPNTVLEEEDVKKLGIIKDAMDKISEIAGSLKTVEDVSQHIVNANAVVEFIKTTLSQLPETISTFTEDFKNQGRDMAQAFINGWRDQFAEATNAAREMQSTMWYALEDKMTDETKQGEWMAKSFIDGWMNTVDASAYKAGNNMQSAIWSGIQDRMSDEYYQGVALSNEFVNGIWSKQGDWWWTGDNIVAGVAGGINRNMWQVSQAAGNISTTAINKLKQLLDIHSPSKVMEGLGKEVPAGFAEGILDGLSEVESAGEALAEAVMDGYNDAIEPLEISAYEARAVADQAAYNGGYSTRSTSVIQNNNIYNNMDMSQALGQIAWEVSRS